MVLSPYRSSVPGGSLRSSIVRVERPLSMGLAVKQVAAAAAAVPPTPSSTRSKRLQPRSADELQEADAHFGDYVELMPELKRLKLQKNNWDSETFQFDEVLTETASQKRVYEVVAKPVVESVLEGYNGTVMAYGQTGIGKIKQFLQATWQQ